MPYYSLKLVLIPLLLGEPQNYFAAHLLHPLSQACLITAAFVLLDMAFGSLYPHGALLTICVERKKYEKIFSLWIFTGFLKRNYSCLICKLVLKEQNH